MKNICIKINGKSYAVPCPNLRYLNNFLQLGEYFNRTMQIGFL